MSSEQKDGGTSVQTRQGDESEHPVPEEPNRDTSPKLAKRTENDKLPVFWAFVILLAAALTVAGFKCSGRIPPEQIELFSNIAMFAVATKGFFALGQPSTLSSNRLSSTLGNLTVSSLAFFMNIDVFGHIVRWNYLPVDLWGWHTGWIICAGSQMLFLSGFAQYMQRQVLCFSKLVGKQVKKAVSFLVNEVKLSDKGVLLIFLTGAALWGAYLGSQISGRGVQSVFSDAEILWGSVLLLLGWTMVGILLYVVPAICKKSKWTICGMDGKRIIIVIGIAAAVMAAMLIFTLLALLGSVKAVLMVLIALAALAGLICAAVKYSVEKILCLNDPRKGDPNGGVPDPGSPDQSTPDQSIPDPSIPDPSILCQNDPNQNTPNQSDLNRSSSTVCRKPNLKDVLVTILAYIVIPLALICIMAILSDEIRKYLTTGEYTWQQLMNAIGGLLQWAGNDPQT